MLIAAIVNMVLGFLWYGPLFGKQWMALSGMTRERITAAKTSSMKKEYVFALIGSLLMSFVLAHAVVFATSYMDVSGVSAGLSTGFWNWLGFVVPVTLSSVLWEGKPRKLWILNVGYYLTALLLMGAIIAGWM